ncbi:hypothetical protein OG949_39915 [Streptomyces scopuliridis]|uniref:hypothetical protein n=1 Tax=Streptomyces scopuliridis TaxID=452529 RepID=UPI002DDA632F|nr:hypothetical protein [Streptomyces scopuliridis]WSB38372.1 hypothetical protein OG949_39915 [Streptomyces scopuliridis]
MYRQEECSGVRHSTLASLTQPTTPTRLLIKLALRADFLVSADDESSVSKTVPCR